MTRKHDDMSVIEATGADTVVTAAVRSNEPAMVEEVLRCLQDSLSHLEVRHFLDHYLFVAPAQRLKYRGGGVAVHT